MKRNYVVSPLNPYVNGYIADNGQYCGSNGQCCLFECQEWINGEPCYPELVRDDKYGFAICPKCGGSYGQDALTGQEYNDAFKVRTTKPLAVATPIQGPKLVANDAHKHERPRVPRT